MQNAFKKVKNQNKQFSPEKDTPSEDTAKESSDGVMNEIDLDPLSDQKVSKSYPVYVIMSLIDSVMDQMKSDSHEFKKLIQICSNPSKSKKLFLDFVRNDSDFQQVVDRECFLRSIYKNESI